MAFNPFHGFRKHKKKAFAILTIMCMFSFVACSGMTGLKMVSGHLPKARTAEVYISLDTIVNTGLRYAKGLGVPVNVKLQPNLPPIGICTSIFRMRCLSACSSTSPAPIGAHHRIQSSRVSTLSTIHPTGR